jgi:hypothetical protein
MTALHDVLLRTGQSVSLARHRGQAVTTVKAPEDLAVLKELRAALAEAGHRSTVVRWAGPGGLALEIEVQENAEHRRNTMSPRHTAKPPPPPMPRMYAASLSPAPARLPWTALNRLADYTWRPVYWLWRLGGAALLLTVMVYMTCIGVRHPFPEAMASIRATDWVDLLISGLAMLPVIIGYHVPGWLSLLHKRSRRKPTVDRNEDSHDRLLREIYGSKENL